ncbi:MULTISPECIES: sugar ABC transporter substrate-binding protein [unclassified Streptomyces]|uniref:sugar ABC transporter substrate-binding protein n=1 Tax=unclassified Streptomyces TaxID=2593676 RepID=UPI002E759C06|nr:MULTISPECIES: substrate-binding domain-containing protein [unclassified Streptomyces]MEE1763824.1 substrate-binding domain-containing protein [Streptomyces sp. SP18BB07]MEE1834972.1 substrate-binding domain-containing protein [Streptomyces sp. SP17KL33]
MNARTTSTTPSTRIRRRTAALRRTATALVASAAAVSLASCGVSDIGDSAEASPTKGDDITVGVLFPDKETKRYEQFDYPNIKKKIAELTDNKGVTRYANADKDPETQNSQIEQMVADKVDIIIVDAVDSKAVAPAVQKADDAGIPVIAYDRLAEGPIDGYVSFDNELVGQVQGRSLVENLGDSAANKIVMMNGSPADPNAAMFKDGALSELQDKVTISESYDTKDWDPKVAKVNMEQAVAKLGVDNIDAVYAANDGIAGAVIDVLKTAGVAKVPPVTGQDADLDAVQRILAGDQYMTVYKSFPTQAAAAAEMAVAKVQGRSIEFDALAKDSVDSPTTKNIPAQLVPPVALTKNNIQDTVVADDIYTVKQICTAAYKSECDAVNLK